ncbi:MAG TPA: sulfur carrier protein ThiS [Baekduia sp.]|nr:sulfur carrier protein ThiS [Baekduia sp.]
MIVLNGTESEVLTPVTVAELVRLVEAPDRGVAVAVDSEVVPRGEWDLFEVSDGARVEILTAVQGG